MKTLPLLFCFVWLVGLMPSVARAADDPSAAATARLRDQLRTTTQQLRTAQSDLTALQSTQGALADQNKALAAENEKLRQQLAHERATAEKTGAELKTKTTEAQSTIKQLESALGQAKTETQKTVEALRVAQAEGEKLKAANIELQRRVSDRETKNLALFTLGNEILTRYEDFSLGRALAAKEPFVGRSRAKLENLMQDYEDRLDEQRATP